MHSSFQALYIPETFAGWPCIYLRIEIYRGQPPLLLYSPSLSFSLLLSLSLSLPLSLSLSFSYSLLRQTGIPVLYARCWRSARSQVPVLEIAWIFHRQVDETKIDGARLIFPAAACSTLYGNPAELRALFHLRVITIIPCSPVCSSRKILLPPYVFFNRNNFYGRLVVAWKRGLITLIARVLFANVHVQRLWKLLPHAVVFITAFI